MQTKNASVVQNREAPRNVKGSFVGTRESGLIRAQGDEPPFCSSPVLGMIDPNSVFEHIGTVFFRFFWNS
jgi:hypothetical protein